MFESLEKCRLFSYHILGKFWGGSCPILNRFCSRNINMDEKTTSFRCKIFQWYIFWYLANFYIFLIVKRRSCNYTLFPQILFPKNINPCIPSRPSPSCTYRPVRPPVVHEPQLCICSLYKEERIFPARIILH